MEKKVNFSLGMLIGLALAALIIMLGVWGWQFIVKSALPPYTSTAPQPSAQPADLPELTSRVATLENDLAYTLRDIAWKMDQKLVIFGWAALLISFVAGFLGIKTYNELDKVISQEVRRALDKALYHLDPTNLRIWVISYEQEITFKGDAIFDESGKQKRDKENQPLFEKIESNVSREMEKVTERLERTGLLNIAPIKSPDKKCFDGVAIIPVFNREMEEKFRDFLDRNPDLDPLRAAFVLYTKDHYVSQTKTLSKYENLATANMPPTAASMVLTVGRGLRNAYPSKKEESK